MFNKIKSKIQLFKTNCYWVNFYKNRADEADKKVRLLEKEVEQWKYVNDIVSKRVEESVKEKWATFQLTSGSGIVMTSFFQEHLDKQMKQHQEVIIDLEKMHKDINDLQTQMKATDKVFFLADKIDKLLEQNTKN